MKIMKFGSKSLATPESLKEVARIIIAEPKQKIIVCSAISGTGMVLLSICELLKQNQKVEARIKIDELFIRYRNFITELLEDESYKESAMGVLEEQFGFLNFILKISYSEVLRADILSQGELLSTKIFSIYLSEQNIKHAVLPALDFMQLDADGEPVLGTIKIKLSQILQRTPNMILLTQGYLVRNVKGEVASLGTGGGDYSAALIAAALNAEVCELWSDSKHTTKSNVTVIRNKAVEHTISYEEAAELAYHSGNLLLPASIWPANISGIPLIIKDINNPNETGTIITSTPHYSGVASIVARDNVASFQITNNKMYRRHGFLAEVFAVFAKFDTSIDLVTTSEIAVAISISDKKNFNEIVSALDEIGTVEVTELQTMISIVGNIITRTDQIIKRIFEALNGIPLSLINFGASPHCLSFIIAEIDKESTINRLYDSLFVTNEASAKEKEMSEYGNNQMVNRSASNNDNSQLRNANETPVHILYKKLEEEPVNTEMRKEKIYKDHSINRAEIEKNQIDFEKFFRDHSM